MFNERVQSSARQTRKHETKRKVLAAAEQLFTQNGFSKTSIRQIAETANVSIGTVMGVGDKRALLIQVVSSWIRKMHDEMRGTSTDLPSVVSPFLDLFTGHEELSRAFGAALIEHGDYGDTLASLKQLLTEEIHLRLADTSLSQEEAEEFTTILYHTYIGLLIGWAAGLHSTEQLHERAKSAINRLEIAFGVPT